MLNYNKNLRDPARNLRNEQTTAEALLWEKLRRKQIGGVQFNRQKPIDGFIVDFYCAAAKLVIELDGRHHQEGNQLAYDQERTIRLEAQGLQVIRFNNQDIRKRMKETLGVISSLVIERTNS